MLWTWCECFSSVVVLADLVIEQAQMYKSSNFSVEDSGPYMGLNVGS